MTPAALSPAVGGTSPRFARLDLPQPQQQRDVEGTGPAVFLPCSSLYSKSPLFHAAHSYGTATEPGGGDVPTSFKDQPCSTFGAKGRNPPSAALRSVGHGAGWEGDPNPGTRRSGSNLGAEPDRRPSPWWGPSVF